MVDKIIYWGIISSFTVIGTFLGLIMSIYAYRSTNGG